MTGWQKLAPEVGAVLPNSAAVNILQKGDKLLSINNHKIQTWSDIKQAIDKSKSPLSLQVLRDNKTITLTLTPKIMETKNIFGENIKRKLIGISPSGRLITVDYPISQSLKVAFDETIDKSKFIFEGFMKMITGVIGLDNISGPVSIIKITSDATQYGIATVLLLAALISVNLGILNLLPIPALDGGHIMFNLYELLTKKQVNEEIMIRLTIFGWLILGSLMILGFYNDISRLISG